MIEEAAVKDERAVLEVLQYAMRNERLGAWVTSREKTVFLIEVSDSMPICADVDYN